MTQLGRIRKKLLSLLVLALAIVALSTGGNSQSAAAVKNVKFVRPSKSGGAVALEKHRKKHQNLRDEFSQALELLAHDCESKQLAEAAAEVRSRAVFHDVETASALELPSHVQPEFAADLPDEERSWRQQLLQLQQEHAKKLYLLSRGALTEGLPTFAYQIVREVALTDPDHVMARRLLGYVRQGDDWVTPFAAKMMRDKFAWHDKFGWLPKAHVARYDNGERFYMGRWIPAEKEAELRHDFRNAWEVRTENYLVKTNVSLERGVEIARGLEEFHDYFLQTFAAFFNTPDQLEKLFRGSGVVSHTRGRAKPYVVHYYRTRDEYLDRLRGKIPMIDITNGLYYTTDRIAYFYHDPEKNNDATLFHEATHQLFYEIDAQDRPISEDANFWVVEGIACYMESYKKESGRLSLGDPRYERFVAARYRFLVDGYYVPLAQFTAMGLKEFQSDTQNIAKNYSQASGLSHFFMEYDNGRYRDALIAYLAQIYEAKRAGRRPPEASLESLVGVDYGELDSEYGQYLKDMEASLAANSR